MELCHHWPAWATDQPFLCRIKILAALDTPDRITLGREETLEGKVNPTFVSKIYEPR